MWKFGALLSQPGLIIKSYPIVPCNGLQMQPFQCGAATWGHSDTTANPKAGVRAQATALLSCSPVQGWETLLPCPVLGDPMPTVRWLP